MTRREKIILSVLVLVALAARIFFAWQGQWSTDPDRGIVSLMALHMAEGRAFPIFYYGQPYMGSVEPAVSALFVRLFGASGFTVCLGTAVSAALLVIPLYFLGRRLGGPAAGTLAAAFLALGPDTFLAYMSSPRGGYALIMLFNMLVLLVAARLAEAAWQGEPTRRRDWMAMGLTGGLGWWIGPMVLPALGAAALVLLVALRGRIAKAGIAWAAAAFALGAAPWLLWNAFNGWASMSMTKSVGGVAVGEALGRLARRTWQALGWGALEGMEHVQMLGLGGGLLLLVAVAAWWAARQRNRAAGWALALVTLYTLLFCAAYGTSGFSRTETGRYVLPLLPALALLLGLAGALLGRAHRALLVVAALALLGPHARAQWKWPRPDPRRAKVEAAVEFGRQLKAAGVDVVMADYTQHWINFASREAVPVAEAAGDCVPLYDRAALLAQRPAYFRESTLKAFRQLARVQHDVLDTEMGRALVNLRPAPERWRILLPAEIGPAESPAAPLMDQNLATGWRGECERGHSAPAATISFRRPVALTGLLLYSRTGEFPMYVEMWGRAGPESDWRNLVQASASSEWYWSGPQAYCWDLYQALEVRCPPEPVTEVQLRLPPSSERSRYEFLLSELVVLEAVEPATEERPDPDALVMACRAQGVQRLYANRWVADRIATLHPPALAVDASARLRRGSSDPRDRPLFLFSTVSDLAGAAFFSCPGALEHNLRILQAYDHPVEQLPVPGGTLLRVAASAPVPARLVWMGDVLLRDTP
jgi:4-amino-4-deoxy-L-arabinose transferase-like glycosyltransferase